MLRINREIYLNQLINKQNNGLVKIITGIRRSGKSFLLDPIFKEYLMGKGISKNHIIKIDFDERRNKKYQNPDILDEYIRSLIVDNDTYYLLLDEIQKVNDFESVLNGFLHINNLDIYVTGSNSKFLSSDVMTEFRGRGDEIHISPLSFSEFYPASGQEKSDAWRDYLYYGGLPHILAESGGEAKSRYLEKLNKEIYLRDMCERYGIRDEESMLILMKVIASAIGSLSNAQKISDTFRSSGNKVITMPTISSYLKYLQESFVVEKAERYDIKGRKYISTPSKYYYSDLGLRNALLNFRQFEETHLMENAIYNELIYRGYSVDVGVVETRVDEGGKKVRKQLAVDFVVNQFNKRYYIQSAFLISDREKFEQEQAPLVKIPDSFKKIVVVGNNTPIWRNEEGITFMGIYDFLLNENSLDL